MVAADTRELVNQREGGSGRRCMMEESLLWRCGA